MFNQIFPKVHLFEPSELSSELDELSDVSDSKLSKSHVTSGLTASSSLEKSDTSKSYVGGKTCFNKTKLSAS